MAERFEAHKQKVRKGAGFLASGILIGLALLIVATLLDRWYESQYALDISRARASTEKELPVPQWRKDITEIQPPSSATIFGEQIPLTNWDIEERFEREFYYNFINADQLTLWWKRSARWFPYVSKQLEDAGLPTDLKYLMVAESGLRNVKSPAGANGFWQFIPATGTSYGLQVDDNIDERLDPRKATQAAIRYFKKMKAEFPTWTLVAAAYNMGEQGVHTAMDWQHAKSYWNLYLNDETMRYVFRIAAIKELMEHGDKYGLNFNNLKPYRTTQTKTVTVNGPIAAIADWAVQQGSTYKDVKIFNPWIVGRSLPAGTYEIDLPASDQDKATVAD